MPSPTKRRPPRAPRASRELPPTREVILALAEQAAALLHSPVFNVGVRDALEEITDEITASEPGETPLRESLYAEHRAMRRVLRRLSGHVQVAQAMTEQELQAELAAESAWEDQYRASPLQN